MLDITSFPRQIKEKNKFIIFCNSFRPIHYNVTVCLILFCIQSTNTVYLSLLSVFVLDYSPTTANNRKYDEINKRNFVTKINNNEI